MNMIEANEIAENASGEVWWANIEYASEPLHFISKNDVCWGPQIIATVKATDDDTKYISYFHPQRIKAMLAVIEAAREHWGNCGGDDIVSYNNLEKALNSLK